MSPQFTLTDAPSIDDLQVFLWRAARVEDGSVRLIADGTVLAVYVGVLHPSGLLDEMPTVLGLRTTALSEPTRFDAVVSVRSLVDRVTRAHDAVTDAAAPVTITMPTEVNTVTWAAISPPRGGWVALDPADGSLLTGVARDGIDEVAASIPTGTGEQLVRKVRSEVWGRGVPGLEHVAAGGAFAGLTLGFVLGGEEVRVFENGPWTRLSTNRGHVLIKRRASSLLG